MGKLSGGGSLSESEVFSSSYAKTGTAGNNLEGGQSSQGKGQREGLIGLGMASNQRG